MDDSQAAQLAHLEMAETAARLGAVVGEYEPPIKEHEPPAVLPMVDGVALGRREISTVEAAGIAGAYADVGIDPLVTVSATSAKHARAMLAERQVNAAKAAEL